MTTSKREQTQPSRPTPPAWFDRRERKRTRTRLMIQAEALRLFAEKGYSQTTVEEIADAADISPRTFFRYFPSKEDVVIWDEFDPLAIDAAEARPDDEPLLETFHALMRDAIGGLYRRDPERLLARHRLIMSEPELRARSFELLQSGVGALASLTASKRKQSADEMVLQTVGAALGTTVMIALDRWARDGGKRDPVKLFDEGVEALTGALIELRGKKA